MILTKRQEEGLKEALRRYNNGEKYVSITGYSGTGKTTLVRFIIEALNVKEEEVCYATFTGKAAKVLADKGNKNAMTLHRLLFKARPLSNGGFKMIPKESLDYKVVVIDEVSMAPKQMIELLFTHNVFVISLGDPFQLPPISVKDSNDLVNHPHIFLDEIMRQAAESEIIRATMQIREGKDLSLYHGNEMQVLPKSELNTGMLTWADQIIVATNNTRININKQMREMLNFGDEPQENDKLICCRNYWDVLDNHGDPLVNGSIGYLKNNFDSWFRLPPYLGNGRKIDYISGSIFSGDGKSQFNNLRIDKNMIITGERSIDSKLEYLLNKNIKTKGIAPLEFTYGYAITCHRAQGSEWDKVLVIEESFPFNKEEHLRWLYTACTRSAQKLVVIKK